MNKRVAHPKGYCVCLIFIAGVTGFVQGCSTTNQTPPSVLPALSKDTATDQFTRGVRDFEGGQYNSAASIFRNIIAGNPGSPFLMEAQWHLAKSYIAMGRKDWAARELNLFLGNYRGSRYEEQARLLKLQLELGLEKVIATIWSPNTIPLQDQLLHLNHPGVNTILLEMPDDQLGKIALSSGSPLSSPLADDRLYEWISTARREKFRVIVKIPLRTMHWAVLARPDWRDQKYDIQKGILQTTDLLDLFQPEVKEMLITLCRNMAAYPIDGIYIDQISYQREEGWTPAAGDLYHDLFLEKLQLAHFYNASQGVSLLSKSGDDPTSVQSWRFSGLKSRYLADLLIAMRTAGQEVRSNLLFGVSIPELLLVDPLEGFTQFSLDYLQLKEVLSDFFVITKRNTVKERMYESLKKYSVVEDIWFEWDHQEGMFPPSQMPIQGIVVSGP